MSILSIFAYALILGVCFVLFIGAVTTLFNFILDLIRR